MKGFREMARIGAVIFDLDGVLTDTAELHYQAWKRLADEEGIPFSRELNERMRGLSRRDSLLVLLNGREVSEEQIHELMERKNAYYRELLKGLTPAHILPGILPLLQALQERGIRIAVASASRNARTVVERLGLEAWIDVIVDGNMVERPKPAPDLFLEAARRLGIPPSECVVVEDAAAGIAAARAAGMRCIGIGPPERVGAADIVLSDFSNISWSELEEQLIQLSTSIE